MKSNNTRTRNGQIEFRYGGYASRLKWEGTDREEIEEREVDVWGPPEWDPGRYSDGSEIVQAIKQKCKAQDWDVREVWRY